MAKLAIFGLGAITGFAAAAILAVSFIWSAILELPTDLEPKSVLGSCIDGDCVSGRGTFSSDDGGTYVGEFLNGFFNGRGTWESGGDSKLRYSGDFVLGWMDGHGEISTKSGLKYSGTFKRDTPNGVGVMRWPNGRIYRGEVRDAKPHGQGTMSLPGEDDSAGRWFKGALTSPSES